MQYSIKTIGGGAEVSITGRLTFAEAQLFPKVLAELDKMGKAHWDIRLDGLNFIDSTGMSLFVHIYDNANAAGTKVVIHGAAGSVREALDRAAFQTLFEFR
jgi:anti-anti-sigma factor